MTTTEFLDTIKRCTDQFEEGLTTEIECAGFLVNHCLARYDELKGQGQSITTGDND